MFIKKYIFNTNIFLASFLTLNIGSGFSIWLHYNNKIEEKYSKLSKIDNGYLTIPDNLDLVFDQGNSKEDLAEDIYFLQEDENGLKKRNNLLEFKYILNEETISFYKNNNIYLKLNFEVKIDDLLSEKYIEYNDSLIDNNNCLKKTITKKTGKYEFKINPNEPFTFKLNFEHKLHYKKGMKPQSEEDLNTFIKDLNNVYKCINFTYNINLLSK